MTNKPVIFHRLVSVSISIIMLVFVNATFTSSNWAATYYLSPTGSDGNSGSISSPWRTFNFAVSKLRPGDVLLLRNGTYEATNSGNLHISCGKNALSGVLGQPITIKAENERQAWVKGNGAVVPFLLINCSYWVIEGLRVSSADNPSNTSDGSVMETVGPVSNLTFRRNLVHTNNRYANGSPMSITITNGLVEENEIYEFHRNGLAMDGDGGIVRRNYVNSRLRADIPGGRYSGNPERGDSGVTGYPLTNSIIENNISENNGVGFYFESAYGPTSNVRWLGNISLNDGRAHAYNCRTENDALAQMSPNHTIENFVAVGFSNIGIYALGRKNLSIKQATLKSNTKALGGLFADYCNPGLGDGDGQPSFFAENVNSFNGGTYGFFSNGGPVVYSVDFPNSYGFSTPYQPNNASLYQNATRINPNLDSCLVFVDPRSSLKGAGKNGADIGANVLYRYGNGVLTNQPLWDPVTGEFPGGAIVPGVNDIPGSSRFDVHQRLNVNTNGCAFPADYASGSPADSPSSSSSAISTEPVAHWKFDEGSGTLANDSSGDGTKGTLVNGAVLTAGVSKGGVSFDGVDDYVDMGNASPLNITGAAMTVQAWAKSTNPGNYKYLVSRTDANVSGYALYTGSSGSVRFYIGNGAGLIITPDVPSPWDDRWHHFVGVYDGSTVKLYIDGVERASVAATGNIDNSSRESFNIGRFNRGGYLFKGIIDEVRVYNRALASSEIEQLYKAGVPSGLPKRPANLIVAK